jgi:polyisoprenoid-binding protein YceI
LLKRRLLFCFLICSLSLAAAERAIELDPARTTIAFTVDSSLHTVHGSFKLKRGSLKFDTAAGSASGEIVVDVTSGETGNGSRDKRMHKEILETPRFPDAIFTPDHVAGELSPQGASQLDVHGVFQIHGASHEMTLHIRAEIKDGELTAASDFEIPYIEWGIKNPSNFLLKVAPKVEMHIQATAKMQ